MLPAKTKIPVNVQLGDADMLPEPPRFGHITTKTIDYKLDAVKERIIDDVCNKYEMYPSFKQNILSNDHLLKICNQLEKLVHVPVDKRELAIAIVEKLIKRTLTKDEVDRAIHSIQFMHNAKLITAPLLVKLYYRVRAIFRV